MTEPTVDIAAVKPGTIQVVARDLHVGDIVFDAHGGEHTLTQVRARPASVVTIRDDGWGDVMAPGETITIRRPR